uniref:F-box domain-containing protein n=1 Tax=Syphacia muris TaxID=451379 RepID=A0A0N5AMY1_9BILA
MKERFYFSRTEVNKKAFDCKLIVDCLHKVCWLYKRLVEEELQKTESLDVTEDYIQIYDALSNTLYLDDVQMRPKKLIHFLANYMPRVRKLSLRSTPFIFQLSDLIQIAKAAPLIEWLDITQVNNKPSFDKDSSMALSYFNNLKTLKMNGFTKLFIKPSRPYELEIPSEKLLHSLEQIEILEERYNECSKEPVVGMLFSLYTTSTVLGRLRHVNNTHFTVWCLSVPQIVAGATDMVSALAQTSSNYSIA